nr:MAG: hypothetical protein TU35_02565 [Thermoproteus sp. AZ2]
MSSILFAATTTTTKPQPIWNGVYFNLSTIIPWYVVLIFTVLYFGLLAWAWRPREGRPFGSFKTIDFVYIALMAALTIVYNFFISPLIPKVGSVTTYFYYPLIGEIFLIGLAAALVGKPGAAGLAMFIYTLLSDIIHYGFGGEPFWFIYEMTAYGALIDLWLIYRGEAFFTPYLKPPRALATDGGEAEGESEEEARPPRSSWIIFADGALSGAWMSLAYPFWWRGFWGTFVTGYKTTVQFWAVTSAAALGAGIVMGIIVAPLIYYIKQVAT